MGRQGVFHKGFRPRVKPRDLIRNQFAHPNQIPLGVHAHRISPGIFDGSRVFGNLGRATVHPAQFADAAVLAKPDIAVRVGSHPPGVGARGSQIVLGHLAALRINPPHLVGLIFRKPDPAIAINGHAVGVRFDFGTQTGRNGNLREVLGGRIQAQNLVRAEVGEPDRSVRMDADRIHVGGFLGALRRGIGIKSKFSCLRVVLDRPRIRGAMVGKPETALLVQGQRVSRGNTSLFGIGLRLRNRDAGICKRLGIQAADHPGTAFGHPADALRIDRHIMRASARRQIIFCHYILGGSAGDPGFGHVPLRVERRRIRPVILGQIVQNHFPVPVRQFHGMGVPKNIGFHLAERLAPVLSIHPARHDLVQAVFMAVSAERHDQVLAIPFRHSRGKLGAGHRLYPILPVTEGQTFRSRLAGAHLHRCVGVALKSTSHCLDGIAAGRKIGDRKAAIFPADHAYRKPYAQVPHLDHSAHRRRAR